MNLVRLFILMSTLSVSVASQGFAVAAQDGTESPSGQDVPPDTPAPDPPSLDDLLDIEDEGEDVDAMSESNRRSLDGVLAEEKPEDAFRRAVEDMQQSAELLGERNATGIGVQRLQQRIVDRLQILINSARRQQQQQQQQQQSSSENSQQNPGRQQDQQQQQQNQQGKQQETGGTSRSESGENTGQESPPPEFADLEGGLEGAGVEWGGLPPRVRDLISQGMRDRVSEVYRSLTEAYYRRLAEESEE